MHKADIYHPNKKLQRKLEEILRLRRTCGVVNWNQENYIDLLQHFGNPHKSVPPVIHVAGTNGKGSVIAMLRSICEESGMRVHCYTSPHLMRVNERIILAGREIDDNMLERFIDDAMSYIGGDPLSFFEVISAVAFRAFSQVPADILLLEVGMGGKLDCTNVIEEPLVSVISRISMDHMNFLGNTIEEIAAQKAGIIKPGVPCAIGFQGDGEQGKKIVHVLRQAAQQMQSDLFISDIVKSQNLPALGLEGKHQRHNAALVIAVIEQIKKRSIVISDEDVCKGLRDVRWPGRLQRIDGDWLDDLSGDLQGHEIWLDCGHNDSAGEALAAQLQEWRDEDNRPCYLILGMLGIKDSHRFLLPMREYISQIYVVPIARETTSQDAEQISELCDIDFGMLRQKDNFRQAVLEIVQEAGVPGRILIAGSTYLAGEVLQFINVTESH